MSIKIEVVTGSLGICSVHLTVYYELITVKKLIIIRKIFTAVTSVRVGLHIIQVHRSVCQFPRSYK